MAVTNFTPLLGLALPTTGDLSGTWGTTVNDAITDLLDDAVAGTTTLSTDANVTLTTTNGADNQARNAIILCTGARTALRTITAPAQSKMYVIINATTGGFGVKIVGAGPTTGVTVLAGTQVIVAWNGSDFVVTSGDVVGPSSSTDNAITRFDSTTGKLVQNSLVTVADDGAIVAPQAGSTIPFYFANQAAFPSASTYHGALAHSHADGAMFFAHGGVWVRIIDNGGPLGTPSSGTATNLTGLPLTTGVTGLLPVANGGTATATPSLVQGANITITGTWPNQTIAAAAPGTGTVTSVSGTGTVNGISLSGTVTSSGNLTLGGALTGVDLSTQVTNTLPVTNGGTGIATTTPYSVVFAGTTATGPFQAAAGPGTATHVLTSNGTGALPTFQAPAGAGNLTGAVTSVGLSTSLGSFTSANLLAALTDETGTGANVFATSPTLITPLLGTPTSGILSSCTVDGTNKVGYLNIPNSGAKTTSYTLVVSDVGKFIELGTGGTVVVPASVFAAGDAISIFNNTSASISCTCSAVTDVYKGGTDADISTFSVTTRGVATILFITATRAVVTGNLA